MADAAWNLLPKDKKKLAEIVRTHGDRENAVLSYRRTMWLLASYYLNGMRRFDVFDPNTKTIVPFYLDHEGRLEFQNQELLSVLDKIASVVASMDLRPRVERQGTSLRLIRDRAAAQVVSDSLVPVAQMEGAKRTFAHLLVTLGGCGVTGKAVKGPGGRLKADIEIVHPKEVMPFPTLGTDITKVRGKMRQRMVSIDRLASILGNDVKRSLPEMDAWETSWTSPEEDPHQNRQGLFFTDERMSGGGWRETGDGQTMVRIREVWIDGPSGTCSRYVLASGDWVGEDLDLAGTDRHCPLGWASCIPTHSFHGLGVFEMLFPIAREVEKLLKNLFSNVRDLDRMGALAIPNGHFNERAMLRDAGNGLKVLNWTPEPGQEHQRPVHIPPPNNGDMPGRVASLGREIMRDISPLRDLLKEKGRVDSGSGLQFLDEQVRQGMTSPTMGTVQAWGSMWRAVTTEAAQMLYMDGDASVPVVDMTVDLAGAVIDMAEGTMSFRRNPLPNVGNLGFTVKHTNPRSEVARKQEALELLKSQFHDADSVRLLGLKEGLDFATWEDEDRSAYEQAVRNILSIYGDGVTPGGVWLSPHTSRPDFQLRIINAFMSGAHMEAASKSVVDSFIAYRETLISYLGQTLPNSIPNPDDLATFANPGAGPQESPDGNAPPPLRIAQ